MRRRKQPTEERAKEQFSNFVKWFEPFNIFRKRTDITLANNETIFSAITRLSNSIASMPLKLYHNYIPVDSDLGDMISNTPNGNSTSLDFIRTMEVLRNSTGNAYALKRYNSLYQVEALDILDSSRVEPVIEKDTMALYYRINTENGQYYVHNMDIIHVKHIHGFGWKGISPIDVLRNSIDYDDKIKEFSLEQLENGVKANFILEVASILDEKKKEVAFNLFRDFYKKNTGVLIEDQSMQIREVKNRDFIDPKVFEVEKITRNRIAAVFNMPPHMVGVLENVNNSSSEQMALEFIMHTLLPIVRMYEQEFDRKLLTAEQRRKGYSHKFNMNGILRADMKTRGDFYFKGVRSGYMTPNEARMHEEKAPMPGGDKLFVSRDLVPIDSPELFKGGE
ncbi:phage portal protein [Bacillus paranthracis]|uniref:phage portal protein n=1 Tax=Bacillus paranthracis TaxID=2026186 RepID=UPI0029C4E169|nr:phage portal protein [Bacillus paranthracis]MDX6048341.1 phage portal protein [Bacillus paranthracis]